MVKTDFDIYIKCRGCLSEELEMHNLFGEFDQGLSLSDILKSTTTCEVEENDGLSPYLCENCTTVVVHFYNFLSVFRENQTYIKSILAEEYDEIKNEANEHAEAETEENSENSEDINESLDNYSIHKNEDFEEITGEYVEPQEVLDKDVSNDHNMGSNMSIKTIRYSCEDCGITYLLRSDFHDHMFQQHNIKILNPARKKFKKTFKKETNLTCQMCTPSNQQVFKTYLELQEHMKSHKNFICETCGAAFRKKSYLDDHVEVHSVEKKHICPVCSKSFRRRTVLVKHKRIHTNPGHAVCEVCGKRFNDKGTLKTHIKLLHTKERDYICIICGLAFPLKATLEKHVFRHQENRKREFQCTVCPMAYKDKSSLNRHVEIKHSNNAVTHICSECGKEYTTKTNLLKHVRRHHYVS